MATAQQDKVCRVLPERTGGRREPLYHLFYSRMNRFLQRPGWALWGASIPVISVTVMGTEEKTNTGSIPMQEDGQMKKSYIREKKYRCGSEYMAVGIYAVTDQEHRRRGKKHKESDRGQKERNKHASLRRKQRKAIANFGRDGFFLTGTYEELYLPEDFAACRRDVENYKRRVIGATVKRFGVNRDKIRMMLWAVRKGEAGRLHMHGFAECVGMGAADRREWREMLEDLWRRRVPGTGEYEPLGTMNADRMDMKKLLGVDGQGKNGTIGYIYGHKERACIETRNLSQPEELAPSDTKWSRRQLRKGCTECAENAYWWEQHYPGFEVVQVMIYDPGQLYEADRPRPDGWEATEVQAYLILRRRGVAKVRT